MKICKICFKEICVNSLRTLGGNKYCICDRCYSKFKPIFIHYKIDGINGISLYPYDDTIKQYIYILKGCYDVELSQVFLQEFASFYKIYFHGYTLVPMPSSKEDDARREFNHVEEIFKCLDLPYLKIIEKTQKYKQSDQAHSKRKEIIKYLKVSNLEIVRNKKILLVDDIVTTGSTLKSAIKLLRPGRPKKIKIMTIAKVMGH